MNTVKPRHVGISIAMIALLILFVGCAPPPPRPARIAPGDYTYTTRYASWLVGQEMRRHRLKGVSVGLVDDQRLVWASAFGYADAGRRMPAKPETLYRVGSVSKVFTVMLAMRLVEQGHLDLDAPVARYLPEFAIKNRFPADTRPITVRDLMTHHSGLPSNYLKGMWSGSWSRFDEVLAELGDEYAAHPPGQVFAYSNLGMAILGRIIERVGGADFETSFQEGIARPAGMTASSFRAEEPGNADWACGYFEGRKWPPLGIRDLPAGSLYSNVPDLGRVVSMVFADGRSGGGSSETVLQPASLAEMVKPQNTSVPLDLDFRIGLGWWLDNQDLDYAGRVAWHHGGFPPYRSHVLLALDHKLGVIVLTNSTPGGDVVEQIAIETVKLAIEAKSRLRPSAMAVASKRMIPGQRVYEFAGNYNTVIGAVPVRKSGQDWQCEMKGHRVFLLPTPDGAFVPQYRLFHLFPIEIEELQAFRFGFTEVKGRLLMTARRHGRWLPMGDRVTPVAIPAAWRKRLGRYQLTTSEPGTAIGKDARLSVRDDLLMLSYVLMPPFAAREHTELALLPVSDDEAVFADGGIVGGETVRVTRQDGSERLRVFGYEFRPVDSHAK